MNSLTWQEISQISASGKASQCFSVGGTKPFSCGSNSMNAKIVGFDRDIDNSSNYAGITFLSMPAFEDFFGSNYFTTVGHTFWDTDCASYLEDDIYGDIESSLRSVIKTVRKTAKSFDGENYRPQYTSEERSVEIFLFSAGEVFSSSEISTFERNEDCVIGAPGSQYPYFSSASNRSDLGFSLLRELSRSEGYNVTYWNADVYVSMTGALSKGTHLGWTYSCCFGFCV